MKLWTATQAYGPDGKLWTAIAAGGWRNDVGARMTDQEMERHMDNFVPGMGLAPTGDQRVENADAKYTPGPWHVDDPYEMELILCPNDKPSGWVNIKSVDQTIGSTYCCDYEQNLINAQLIAAATDMREAGVEIDRLLLVIESAVRSADPSQHRAVLAALQANRAAITRATAPQTPPSDHQSDQAHSEDEQPRDHALGLEGRPRRGAARSLPAVAVRERGGGVGGREQPIRCRGMTMADALPRIISEQPDMSVSKIALGLAGAWFVSIAILCLFAWWVTS